MSEASSSSPVSVADYAPSPNTCSMALTRANQLRVQALLRQMLIAGKDHPKRLDTLRVLRRTIREIDYHLSWPTQVDFFETLERLLREESDLYRACDAGDQSNADEQEDSWRLTNDSTQLLIESIPRLPHEIDAQIIRRILAIVVQNLGHQRSEVRRASLLLVNMYINERPNEFQQVLKLFIDNGLANQRNPEAQRGAILSLPLLMTEQIVRGEDLLPLVRCLSELLVDANAQLFYSLYLALQRLHLTLGDQQFAGYLRQCDPEATLLYKQAQSRHNSLAGPSGGQQEIYARQHSSSEHSGERQVRSRRGSIRRPGSGAPQDGPSELASGEPKQVTFENDTDAPPPDQPVEAVERPEEPPEELESSSSGGSLGADTDNDIATDLESEMAPIQLTGQPARQSSAASSAATSSTGGLWRAQRVEGSREEEADSTRVVSRKQSSVSSTCSSEAQLVNPAHYMSQAALSGRPMFNYDQIHHVDHSSTGLAINDLAPSCTPTMELGPNAQHELKFGIFPRHLVGAALNARQSDRMEALQAMMCIIRDSPINHLAILITYFDSFLEQFLARLMEPNGTDFELELIAIDMIETIVIKTKVSTMQFVRPLIGLLVKTLGDSRGLMFRESSVRVIHKMMAFLPPQHVIDALFEHKHSKSALVREECVNRITGAVIEYDRNEFNLTKLCYHVLPMLADHQASVRLAAIECIGALAQALGPERIGSLLTAAEAVQTGCDYDGLLEAINARLRRRALPRCNPDGSLRFVIRPLLSATSPMYLEEREAADVRWVLEAPSSHQQVTLTAAGHLQHQALFSHQAHWAREPAHQAQAHRPGAYSPPDLAQQRRCSVSLSQLAANRDQRHQHHHHHQRYLHEQRLHSVSSGDKAAAESPPRQQQQQVGRARRQSGAANEHCERPNGCGSPAETSANCGGRSAGQLGLLPGEADSNPPDASEISRRRQASGATRADQWQPEEEAGRTSQRRLFAASSMRRSNSQESVSSSDTNKVLFQYYLGKFKQSLMEPAKGGGTCMQPVLPSDSLIYTDSVQAYALSRHKSRQQQTSFDYDSDSVGRVPTASSLVNQNQRANATQALANKPNDDYNYQEASKAASDNLKRLNSSGSESPLTVMEAARRGQADGAHQATATRRENAGEAQRRKRSSRGPSQEVEEADERERAARAELPSPGERRKSLTGRRADSEIGGRSARKQSVAEAKDSTSARRKSVVSQVSSPGADKPADDECDTADAGRASGEAPPRSGARGALVRQSASLAADTFAGVEVSSAASRTSSGSSSSFSAASSADKRQESSRRGSATEAARPQPSEQPAELSADEEAPLSPARRDDDSAELSRGRKESRSRRDAAERPEAGGRERRAQEEHDYAVARRRSSRSQPPPAQRHHHQQQHQQQQQHQASAANAKTTGKQHLASERLGADMRRAVSVSPSLASNVNIRHILENVAQVEGAFQEPQLALKVAMEALEGPCWSTKVEGLLALIRLAAHHQQLVVGHLHEVVGRIVQETRNLRSTVARSAIFALGDFCDKLKRAMEPELDALVQALLQKSTDSTGFIRDDIRRALASMLEQLTQWRLANALICHGAGHKNALVRRMASQHIALIVERMGAAKCLVGARDIGAQLIPAAAKFAQDGSPQTRYFGRLILSRLVQHSAFERLLRKYLAPNLYRSTLGVIESVKRRGTGEPPPDS